MHRNVPLNPGTKESVLAHIERLWGHDVALKEVSSEEA
jgi:spore cortex formation protein SpoVR/YcgB (stage V sporulation)